MSSPWLLNRTKRYEPIRLLGQGGMGAVYEVEDTVTGGRLALKVMLAPDARRLLRFKQEFRIMADFHHRNLVRLFDLGYEDDRWYFTMELVDGQSILEALILDTEVDQEIASAPTTLTPDELEEGLFAAQMTEEAGTVGDGATGAGDAAPRVVLAAKRSSPACHLDGFVAVMGQVLDALEFLHSHGVVHRDLKPGNILVDIQGVVRVLDFGLASRIDRQQAISKDGAVVGTLAYMSPEQCLGQEAGPASDLYALGCMMFELLTGRLPFGGTMARAIQARLTGPAPRVQDRVADVPTEIAEICHALLARAPAERPSIAQVRTALGIASAGQAGQAGQGSGGETTLSPMQPFVGRRSEMDTMNELAARVEAGKLQLALVSGSSGIGKSALAAMVARRARNRGFMCFEGRCYERERVPFVAFDRAVDAMILTLARWPRGDLDPIRDRLGDLGRIFPAFGLLDRRPHKQQSRAGAETGPAREDPDPRELSQRAFDAFCHLLEHLQRRAPVLLVLDDLQWVNEESIALLEAMLGNVSGRIFILALFRPEGIGDDHPLSQLLVQVAGRGDTVRIDLEPLGPDEAVELVDAVAGIRLDSGTATALAEQAEGNPFLTLQMAEYLAQADQPIVDSDDRAARLDVDLDGLLRGRIEALSTRAETVLSLAATAGGDVSTRLLVEASDMAIEDFYMAIGELMALRLFKALPVGLPESPGDADDDADAEIAGERRRNASQSDSFEHMRVDLYHDRLRVAAYERLHPDRRRRLHRALAVALEALEPAVDGGLEFEALLRHWSEAGDSDKRRHYALEAAEQAAGKLAFRHAAHLFRIVLDDPEPGVSAQTMAARWERVGDLCEYSGHLDEAREAYERALSLWLEAGDDSESGRAVLLRLYSHIAETRFVTGLWQEGSEALQCALELLGLKLHRTPRRQTATLAWLRSRVELMSLWPGRRSAGEATSFALEQIRFFDAMVRVLPPLWPEIAAEMALRGELLGRRLDDKRVLQRAMASRALIPVFWGRQSPRALSRARKNLDEAEDLARRHHLPGGLELVQLYRGILMLPTDMNESRRLNEAAQEGFARLGMTDFHDGVLARAVHLVTLALKGDFDEALERIDKEVESPRTNIMNLIIGLILKARLLAQRVECDEAERALQRVESLLKDKPPSELEILRVQARCALWTAQGRFADVVEETERFERQPVRPLLFTSPASRAFMREFAVVAHLGLIRGREPSARERARLGKRTRELARWLIRNGAFDQPVSGYWGLTLLAHNQGRTELAKKELDRVLDRSSKNTNPYRRWLCLEAARELGAMTPELEAEARDLATEGKFSLPVGWRR